MFRSWAQLELKTTTSSTMEHPVYASRLCDVGCRVGGCSLSVSSFTDHTKYVPIVFLTIVLFFFFSFVSSLFFFSVQNAFISQLLLPPPKSATKSCGAQTFGKSSPTVVEYRPHTRATFRCELFRTPPWILPSSSFCLFLVM